MEREEGEMKRQTEGQRETENKRERKLKGERKNKREIETTGLARLFPTPSPAAYKRPSTPTHPPTYPPPSLPPCVAAEQFSPNAASTFTARIKAGLLKDKPLIQSGATASRSQYPPVPPGPDGEPLVVVSADRLALPPFPPPPTPLPALLSLLSPSLGLSVLF